MNAAFRRALAAAAVACATAACELREITIVDAADVAVAEFVLVAGATRQTGVIHRTEGTARSGSPLAGAAVTVTREDGAAIRYADAPADLCLIGDDGPDAACYASPRDPAAFVVPDQRYDLRVELADGRVLTGRTTVPAAFAVVRPASIACRLAPGESLDIVWRRSPTAWVYAAETEMRGLRAALAPAGIEVKQEPLRLFGLAISNSDTTIAFPAEFGVFDRFDPDLTPVLAAIQDGLPADVDAEIVIAAADRNYVNWERGGNFNPSGFVRVPSVFGDGTGAFGAIFPRTFLVSTRPLALLPPC